MAFLQSDSPHQPIFRVPAIVSSLIGLLVALHGGRMLLSPAQSERIVADYAFIPARYSPAFQLVHHDDPGNLLQRLLPFVTYMGLHGDWTHVAINCFWLLAFGPVVARRFGAGLFLLFFLVCGIAGALTFLAFDWGELAPVVGASGAISGLMGAAIRMLSSAAPWAEPGTGKLLPLASRQIVMFSLIWGLVNLATGYAGLGFLGSGSGAIAWQAHLGGYLAGLLLAGLFDRLRRKSV